MCDVVCLEGCVYWVVCGNVCAKGEAECVLCLCCVQGESLYVAGRKGL